MAHLFDPKERFNLIGKLSRENRLALEASMATSHTFRELTGLVLTKHLWPKSR